MPISQVDLPCWRRLVSSRRTWLESPPGGRALLLSGARQTGNTTLFLQTINRLLARGVPSANYATFDHPLLKLGGLDTLLRAWRESQPAEPGPEYLFLDEIQMAKDWQVWVKHQVDFEKRRRIAVTGSATPLLSQNQESGVGRWQTLRLATLSFYGYLRIRGVPEPGLPAVSSLREDIVDRVLKRDMTAFFGVRRASSTSSRPPI
jgi:uncharacterized protein